MAAKYSKAPISEVIFGVFFKSNTLLPNSVFFNFLSDLSKDYPVLTTHPATTEEELVDGVIQSSADYQRAGFSAYRYMTIDGKWNVIVQQNMLTLHWVRQDVEAVGNYPGFENIFSRFIELLNNLKLLIGGDSNLFDNIKNCYLSYTDRVDLEPFKGQGKQLQDLLSISGPGFTVKGRSYQANNYFARYSTPCPEVNGFAIMSLNSPTIPPIGQILIVDNKVKGLPTSSDNIDEWFHIAHEIQVSYFESIFTNELLNTWK